MLLTFIFIDTTNTTSDIKTERDIDKKNISATAGYIFITEHFEKILVILAGTVSSLILLMFIAREILNYFECQKLVVSISLQWLPLLWIPHLMTQQNSSTIPMNTGVYKNNLCTICRNFTISVNFMIIIFETQAENPKCIKLNDAVVNIVTE